MILVLIGVVVGLVLGLRKLLKMGRARLAEQNGLEEALSLWGDFARQFTVLTTKLKNGEEISPAAVEHFAYTYKKLMPLLLSHRFTLNWQMRQTLNERGDYSPAPDVVKACEQMHDHVTQQIQNASAGSATEAQAMEDLLSAFGSELKSLQKDFTPEGLARLSERAESLKLALPQAAKYWNVETMETVCRMLAKADEMVASLGNENEEGADLDPYKVLGVAPTASMEEIEVAQKAKILHPDSVPDELKEAAEETFKGVQAAYQTLRGKAKAAGAS